YFAVTKYGQIKRVERNEFTPCRTYKSKSTKYAKLKDEEDVVITVSPVVLDDIILMTEKGNALRFNIEEVPNIGDKS
ncbi:DNA gyrase C-terminal beta-propeller domain-containing protein, partial [Streptococcus suis]